METPQKIDFMQELMKVLLDALRRQAFSVILLVSFCALLGWALLETRKEYREQAAGCEAMMREMRAQMDKCEMQREALSVRVAELTVRVDLLSVRRK